MKRYDWCSFSFDLESFPDPEKYLAEIKEKYNVKVCAWINPYISTSPLVSGSGTDFGPRPTRGDL